MMTDKRGQHRGGRQRGLVIVLVMVALVLLVALGTGYMQMTRSDRLANAAAARQGITQVEQSVTQYIADVLRDDLFGDGDSTFPYTVGDVDAGVEPFDAPFTNPDNTKRGMRDDMWLGSSHLDFTNATDPVVPHLTNLMGMWVDLPRIGAPDTTDPIERTTTPNNNANTGDTNIPVFGNDGLFYDASSSNYEPRGGDATGNGYPDSRWTWAPIRQIGDVVYVMAVHIVDLSGYLNVNTATAQSAGSPAVVQGATEYPRFWYPSELDVHRSLLPFSEYAPAELAAAGSTGLLPALRNIPVASSFPTTWTQRNQYWAAGVASGFNPSVTTHRRIDTVQTEAELRHRGGLNNDRLRTLLEAQMPLTLQDGDSGDMAMLNPTPTAAQLSTYATDLRALYEDAARNAVTVMSGTGFLAPARGGVTEVRELLDLNDLMIDPADPRYGDAVVELATLLQAADGPFGTGATIPFGGNSNVATAQHIASLIDYFDADLSPADLSPDQSSAVTKVSDGSSPRYGMEAAPFLTEVYIQAKYWLTRALEAPAPAPPGNYQFGWSRMGNVGYAIELVNPWASPVLNLEDIRIGTVNAAGTFTAWDTLYDLTNERTLDPGEGIILYHNSGGGASPETANDEVKTVLGWGLPAGWTEVDMNGQQTLPASQDVIVELQIRVDPAKGGGADEWVTYSRIQARQDDGTPAITSGSPAHLFMPPNLSAETDPAAPYLPGTMYELLTDKYERYVQKTAMMNAQGLNPIVVKVLNGGENEIDSVGTLDPSAGEGATEPRLPPNDAGAAEDKVGPIPGVRVAPGAGAGSTGIARITSDLKPGTTPIDGATELDGDSSFANRRYAFDDVAIRFPTDLTRVMWVGPTDTQTYAQVFREAAGTVTDDPSGTPDALRSRMLPWSNVPSPALLAHPWVAGTPHDMSVPRTALLMDRVTAVPLPAVIDTATGERALDHIPGRININTAPLSLIRNALPINDATLRDDIALQIDQMRRGDTSPPLSPPSTIRTRGNRPGIASIGELMQLPAIRDALTSAGTPVYDTYWPNDPNSSPNQVPIAFDGGGNNLSGSAADMPIDDRTEEVRLAGFLANVFTVRSDRFAAYIYIRGYKVDQFHLGPVEASRFMVIYDRSNLTDPTDATQRVRTYGPFRVD